MGGEIRDDVPDQGQGVVTPIVVQKRTARNTPFISNSAKDAYVRRMKESQPIGDIKIETTETDDKKTITTTENTGRPRPTGSFQGNPAQRQFKPQGNPLFQATSTQPGQQLQPSLELKIYNNEPPFQKPQGLYATTLPYFQLPGTRPSAPNALQFLGDPLSVISTGPNIRTPLQQVYPMNLPGPTGAGHVQVNKLYENVFPKRDMKFNSVTIGVRLMTYDFVNQILIRSHEGEYISLDSTIQKGQRNLFSEIKLMELYPDFYNPITHNPYRGLPKGLLIYRSCFPIRLDPASNTTMCGPDSIRLTARFYALSLAEFLTRELDQPTSKEYDVWRELNYYEYIRQNIIKPRRCPNFPILYAYFYCHNRNIDFYKLKKNCMTQKDALTEEYFRFKRVRQLLDLTDIPEFAERPLTLPDATRKIVGKLHDEIDPSLQEYSGRMLILVTEAPTHNLYQWAQRIYDSRGAIEKMTASGYHSEHEWYVVLFQIVAALYVMQLFGIYMRDMTIEDNVYIVDLPTSGKPTGYWKYQVEGIPYYIPNYGSLVFLDSNFKDIIPGGQSFDSCLREYKIFTHNIIGNTSFVMGDVRKKVYENYRRIVTTNAFTQEHTLNGVWRPPEPVMKLLEIMMTDTEQDLSVILSRYFRFFMNNRIGTYLRRDTELPNIREITGSFKAGEIAIEVIEDNVYKWCQVVAVLPDGKAEIITRSEPTSRDFINKTVSIDVLKQYPISEKIEQDPTSELSFAESELLETYNVSS